MIVTVPQPIPGPLQAEELIPQIRSVQNVCQSERIRIEVPFMKNGGVSNDRWESEPQFMFISPHYEFSLVIRPNGLKYTEGHGNAMGVWFRPLPSSNNAADFSWPAKVKISISVLNKWESEVITTSKEDFKWDKNQTRSRYPAFKFNLTAIKHSKVKQSCVNSEGYVTVVVKEYELDPR